MLKGPNEAQVFSPAPRQRAGVFSLYRESGIVGGSVSVTGDYFGLV